MICLAAALATALSSCDTLETRSSAKHSAAPVKSTGRRASEPGEISGGSDAVAAQSQNQSANSVTNSVGTLGANSAPNQVFNQSPPLPTPPPNPVALPPPSKSNIRVGVIVGPGGMKSYAALGVFREMNRARIPISAIAGLEWGSVIGGLYATQGQINDAEWKSYKLRDENLPEKGFLQSKASPASISKLDPFLDEAFGGLTVDKAKIDFACATVDKGSDRTGWLNRGSFKQAMQRCLPYPPMFEVQKSIASPFAVEDAAAWLRSRGANVILLIDVLGQGDFLPSKSSSDMSPENLLWVELRREMFRAKPPAINHVIHVNTSGHPVTDFDGRRQLMDAGQAAATDVCNKMVSQYGF